MSTKKISELSPLPILQLSTARRVLAKAYDVSDDDLDEYLAKELLAINEENPVVAATLMSIFKEERGKSYEAAQTAIRAGVAVYHALRQETIFDYRKFCLKTQQMELFAEKKQKELSAKKKREQKKRI